MASTADFPAPTEGMVLTSLIIVNDVDKSRDFYHNVLGAEVVMEREPAILKFQNSWIIINVGGGPTEDKPGITLAPPTDTTTVSSFMNIRVADIQSVYDDIVSKGGEFITPPIDRGAEIRCYLTDPDGYIIEFGQATGVLARKDTEAA